MYVPLTRRRIAVEVVFGVIVAVALVAVVSDVAELQMVDRVIAGEPVSDAELDRNDARQRLIGAVQFVVYLIGAIVFIRWLHLAYGNIDTIAPHERRYGTGWAIGAWFVPILNLWRPKQIVNDVWRAGRWDRVDEPGYRPGALLLVWWLAFVVAWWATRPSYGTETPEDVRAGTVRFIVSDSLDIVAAVLAVLVVRAASRRLDEAGARAATTPEPPPELPERPVGAAA